MNKRLSVAPSGSASLAMNSECRPPAPTVSNARIWRTPPTSNSTTAHGPTHQRAHRVRWRSVARCGGTRERRRLYGGYAIHRCLFRCFPCGEGWRRHHRWCRCDSTSKAIEQLRQRHLLHRIANPANPGQKFTQQVGVRYLNWDTALPVAA